MNDNIQPQEKQLTTGQWLGFFSMSIGLFMAILDIQIVASSIQQIQAGLSATQDEVAWVQTSYLIAEVIIIPLSGWLTHLLSTRYVFILSAGGFTLASLACAFAWNLPSMIVFRCLQGFMGGAMIPVTFSVIFVLFPPRLQTTITIVLGLIVTLAPTIGPVLGGYLTDTYSWQVLFLINVIPGFLVCFFVWKFLHVDEPDWSLLKKIDFVGILLIAIFLSSTQYFLEEGAREQWFEDHTIATLAVISLISGTAMFIWEFKTAHPIIDLYAFRNINFAVGCAYSFILGLGMYGVIYLTPVYLSSVQGLNSLQIGYYLMVVGLFQLVSAVLAGILKERMDLRTMLALGLGMFGLGCWLNGQLTHDSLYWELFLPQAIRGLAMMLCFLPINTLALGLLPPEEIKNASGLYNLTRNLGGAIGLALINTIMIYLDKSHYAMLRDSVSNANQPALFTLDMLTKQMAAGGMDNPKAAALSQLTQMTWREAHIMTFNNVFQIIAVIFFAALLVAPFLKKVDAEQLEGGGH